MNYEASLGERNLKWWAKLISSTARKCGETTFIIQTAARISDHLLLGIAPRMIGRQQSHPLDNQTETTAVATHLSFTRKSCDAIYTVASKKILICDNKGKPKGCVAAGELLPPPGADLLARLYPTCGNTYLDSSDDEDVNELQIWKEVRLCPDADKKQETNLSAWWVISFDTRSGLPKIEIVDMSTRQAPMMVHEQWSCCSVYSRGTNMPRPADIPANTNKRRDKFSITESYSPYGWLLNCVDRERWEAS
jgi:hypothetical protein